MESWLEIRPLPDMPGLSRRAMERTAWRAIVCERIGTDTAIAYNENGAPVLSPDCGYIGVSHTRGWVAVIWSPTPCAIDIEFKTRGLPASVAARYSFDSMEEWCAFEAAFKFKGLTGTAPDPSRVSFIPHPTLIVAVIRDL